MARVVGVQIPDQKKIRIALTSIRGIGHALSARILQEVGIDPEVKTSTLKPEELNSIKEVIEKKYRVESDLKRDTMSHIKRLKDIGSWRGSRHTKRLPVRGQQTRTNTRTVRGNVRKTVGSGRKVVTK
ncbi:MAG: 30S ribosomal protein S13 [bacterium]|nr:30S ribosomal protein S13 [bacterium]